MNMQELKQLRDYRLAGETINETKERLMREGILESQDTQDNAELSDDSIISRVKIIQKSCRIEGTTPGHYYNTATEEEFERLENVVLLKKQNTRALFPADDFSGKKACWSNDGFYPAANEVINKTGNEPKAPLCASKKDGKWVYECPYAQWRNGLGEIDPGGTKPPLCKASVTFLGLSDYVPFWIVFHGAAMPVVKDFLRFVAIRRDREKQKGVKIGLSDFRVTLALEKQKNKRGEFYVPAFLDKELIVNDKEKRRIRKFYEGLHGHFFAESQ